LPPSLPSDDRSLELADEFSEFCASLVAADVEFLLVGAYAVALHGAPRFTGDFDVLVRPTVANGRKVLAAIEAFGFPIDPLGDESFADPATLVEMGVPPLQIHVMTSISGVTWDEAWSGRTVVRLGAQDVPVIGRHELLANKRAAGRPKDLADIDALDGQ
jgi:hypothetical protein